MSAPAEGGSASRLSSISIIIITITIIMICQIIVCFWPLGGFPRKESLAGLVISRRHSFNLGSDHRHRQWRVAPSDLGAVQPLFQKDSSSPRTQIKIISAAVLSLRGALAIVTDAGQDAVDADVLQTSGTEADGEVVWS
jgi:hypothetical protein